MNGAQKAILPGMMIGMLVLVSLTRLLGLTETAQASTEEAPAIQAWIEEQKEWTNSLPVIFYSEVEEPVVEVSKAEPAQEEERDADSREGCSVSSNFPDSVLRWCDLIDRHAADHGLDPDLVAAVILQESNGNPDAYSSSGAVGLMQVMPRDGIAAGFQCVNGPCFASRPSMSELYDPDFNVAYGTRMLAGLIQKRGSIREGLFAYGPSNMGYYYADKVLGIYEARR